MSYLTPDDEDPGICVDCMKVIQWGFADYNVDEYGDARCLDCHERRLGEIEKEMEDDVAVLDAVDRAIDINDAWKRGAA